MNTLPELKVTACIDYICPFCYLGNYRLQTLRASYDLKVNWCLLEIHPQTDAAGDAVTSLDYPDETWQKMMRELHNIARQEAIPLNMPDFIPNSQRALLLSEASKLSGKAVFYCLHNKLFESYFVDGCDIGNAAVLTEIALQCGVSQAVIDAAWNDQQYKLRLQKNYSFARQHAIQSVPAFLFGEEVATGLVSHARLQQLAQQQLTL